MWIVDIHNSVDPNNTKSYDDTFQYYMKEYNVEVNENKTNISNSNFFYISIFFIIIFLIYQIYLNL